MRYRRSFQPGGSYFFTVVTEGRRSILTGNSIDVLREAFRRVREKYPFEINAIAILPDHLHCIWTLPPQDSDFSTRWRLIKTGFTKDCDPALHHAPDATRIAKNQQAIWQHRYWEHSLRDDNDFNRHVDYIHYNPVKHGLADRVKDWPHSSFHRYVANGLYPPDWGSSIFDMPDVGSE